MDDFIQIELKGKHAKEKGAKALISMSNAPLILEYDWYLGKNGYPITYGSKDKKIKFSCGYKMHKMLFPNVKKGYVVDHINRDRLDNRLSNLRICTIAQNNYNRSHPKNSKYKYKGIAKEKDGVWTAYVMKDGKRTEINGFSSEKEAAKVYDLMAEELLGQYASKNF